MLERFFPTFHTPAKNTTSLSPICATHQVCLTAGHDTATMVPALASFLGLDPANGNRAALPEQCSVDSRVETFVVPPSDPRVGLRGQQGVRVSPSCPYIPPNTVLGSYRAFTLTEQEWNDLKTTGRDGGCGLQFGLDAGEVASVASAMREELIDVFTSDYTARAPPVAACVWCVFRLADTPRRRAFGRRRRTRSYPPPPPATTCAPRW